MTSSRSITFSWDGQRHVLTHIHEPDARRDDLETLEGHAAVGVIDAFAAGSLSAGALLARVWSSLEGAPLSAQAPRPPYAQIVRAIERELGAGGRLRLLRARKMDVAGMATPESEAAPTTAPSSTTEDETPTAVIHFLRGPVCPCVGVAGFHDTPVAMALPARVVGKLFQYSARPIDGELVQVRVRSATDTNLQIQSSAETLTLEVDAGVPNFGSRKKLLLWFGDAGDLGGAHWDDIVLLNVSAGGGGLATKVTARCSGAEAELGVMDVLIEDPGAAGTFRTARHGLFKTRTPTLKIAAGVVPTAQLQVWLDDGDDDTDDELDITNFVGLAGELTTVPEVPEALVLDGSRVKGTTNTERGRRRRLVEGVEPPPAADTSLFIYGENRLQVRKNRDVLFCAHSFHYTETRETVPPGHYRIQSVPLPGGAEGEGMPVMEGTLALDFKDGADDVAISTVLHALRLSPRAYAGQHRVVGARLLGSRTAQELVERYNLVGVLDEPLLESRSLAPASPLDAPPSGVQELYPAGMLGDFNNATSTFTNAPLHWHHWVIHTFPALRLIDSILVPRRRPPVVSISGVQFETAKTFIRPGAADGVRAVLELNDDDASRKLALFGHTDRVGSDANNNGLSLVRAQSMHALLTHAVGWWLDRFDAASESVSSNRKDIQWALRELGHYGGPVDGVDTPAYQAAVHAFQGSVPMPVSAVNAATRQALARAIRQRVGAVNAPLTNEKAWATREVQQMLKHLGHYTGSITGTLTAATVEAIKKLQRAHELNDDGSIGVLSRVVLIRDYMQKMVPAVVAPARFHANGPVLALFGCGEAHPRVPTADGVESVQNRRVEVVFRRAPVDPIDPVTQVGAACPYPAWLAPELDDVTQPNIPPVVIAFTDSGFGLADDFRGEQLTQPNRLFIKGERWIRPTNATGATAATPKMYTVAATGDLRNLSDVSGGHGTAVITCCAADGVGDPVGGVARGVNNLVMGVAPHVKVRPIQTQNDFWTNMLALEIMAADPDVKIHSTSSHLYRTSGGVAVTNQQWRALQERLQDFAGQGKLSIASAGNYRTWLPGEYDTATRQFGREANDRRSSRGTYAGADAHRARVLIVGSSAQVSPIGAVAAPGQQDTVANHTYLGEQVGLHTPGESIRAVSVPLNAAFPNIVNMGAAVAANGLRVGGIGGTSFATPMTAGIVGELMLLDADLTQPANLARAFEYVEATADPLPNVNPAGGSGAGAGNPRSADPGVPAGVPPFGPQPPTAATTYQNIRRMHYWKAALAAVNKGLASDGRGAAGSPDPFFTLCTLRDDGATVWYGFEVRSHVASATLWWKQPDGRFVPVEDTEAVMPGNRTAAAAWRTSDAYQLAANQPLPAYPWTAAAITAAGRLPYFLCQFTIKKEHLQRFQSLVVHLSFVDPVDPDGPLGPPVMELRVDDRATLRNPAGAAAAPELWKQAINALVVFDDFVFHLTNTPQPLDHFVFFAEHHRTGAGVGQDITVDLFAVDRFGHLTNPGAVAVNVTHNGTAGAAAPANAGVFLNGAPSPQAGVPPNFGAAVPGVPGLARLRFRGHTQEQVTLSINDGAGHAGSIVLDVHPAGPVSAFRVELQRRGGGASVVNNPVATNEPFEAVVTAIDDDETTVTTYTGAVTLSLLHGQPGQDGPPATGVHVKAAEADPFREAAFTHNFVAADNGVFAFPLFDHTVGSLQVKAADANFEGESRTIDVIAGPVASFRVQANTPQTVGGAFNVSVTAIDAHGNVIDAYNGAVTLSVAPGHGTAGALAADGTRSGAFINDTSLAADDTYTFTRADHGSHEFRVTCYTAETVRFQASDGAVTTVGTDIVVRANAVHHFAFRPQGAYRVGTAFDLEIVAEDASNNRVPSYTGNVTLTLTQGTAFAAGPPPRGVRVETAPGTLGNAHAYVSGDNGSFTFTITPFTAENVQFQASDGAVTSTSNAIAIRGGALDHFAINVAAAQANVPFAVTVTAQDASNNTVTSFVGSVQLRSRKGVVAFTNIPGASHTYTSADNGVHVFMVTLTSSGANFAIQATDQSTTSTSGNFNVAP